MSRLTENQQLGLITQAIGAVSSRFSSLLTEDFSPETKNYFKGTCLAELDGIMTTVFYVFGRECSVYKAAKSAWEEINAYNCY